MIVRLRPRGPPFFVEDETVFFDAVRVIFTQKNKRMRNAILPFLSKFRIPKKEALKLADNLPFYHRRPRKLAPEEIGLTVNELARALYTLDLL